MHIKDNIAAAADLRLACAERPARFSTLIHDSNLCLLWGMGEPLDVATHPEFIILQPFIVSQPANARLSAETPGMQHPVRYEAVL